jgi:hypothetical protein
MVHIGLLGLLGLLGVVLKGVEQQKWVESVAVAQGITNLDHKVAYHTMGRAEKERREKQPTIQQQ